MTVFGLRRSSALRVGFYLIVVSWILSRLHQLWTTADSFYDTNDTALVNENTDFDPTRVIFLISMGDEAKKSKLVERFVWSARHRGEWQGYIVLLTDASIDRYAGFSHRFIVMNPEERHFNHSFRDDMPYKRFKTRVIEYLDKDNRLDQVRLIYYLDVDNIIGNSLPKMMQDLETKYNIPGQSDKWFKAVPRMWFFANKYQHLSVQGGQFVVDRYGSQPCLLAWREKIDANVTEAKDQPSLHRIRGNGRNQECQIIAMMPKNHLYFPANSTVHEAVDKIRKGVTLTYPTLVHIKNSCNVTASIPSKIEELYVQDIVRNAEFSKKIHIRPDQ